MEKGSRGFVTNYTAKILKKVGHTQRKAIKELATVAEKSSCGLWGAK